MRAWSCSLLAFVTLGQGVMSQTSAWQGLCSPGMRPSLRHSAARLMARFLCALPPQDGSRLLEVSVLLCKAAQQAARGSSHLAASFISAGLLEMAADCAARLDAAGQDAATEQVGGASWSWEA